MLLTVQNDQAGDTNFPVVQIVLGPANCWSITTQHSFPGGEKAVDIKRLFEVWRNQTRIGIDVFQIIFTPDNLWDIRSVAPGEVSVNLQGYTGTVSYQDSGGNPHTASYVNGVLQSPG